MVVFVVSAFMCCCFFADFRSLGFFNLESYMCEGLLSFGHCLNYSFLFVICTNTCSPLSLSFDSDLSCPVSCVLSLVFSTSSYFGFHFDPAGAEPARSDRVSGAERSRGFSLWVSCNPACILCGASRFLVARPAL